MAKIILVSVDELWLKGKNRSSYNKALSAHLKSVIKCFCKNQEVKTKIVNQQYILRSEKDFSSEFVDILKNIPGIGIITPSYSVKTDEDEILDKIVEELSHIDLKNKTFRVTTQRAWKKYPKEGPTISKEIGGRILGKFPNLGVLLTGPDIEIKIKIYEKETFISVDRYKGIGGLPFGTSGAIVTLLSGGFDSPVASYLMSRRGCSQTFVFFHAYPFVGDEVKDKILKLSKKLATFQKYCQLYVVPFGEVQQLISQNCREEYRTILFRKYMIKAAELIKEKTNSTAICTGDALAQVSSQTIHNMEALNQSTDTLILRPLVGFNKFDILKISRDIGTYDISVIPHDDACSLLAPKSPIIKPDKNYWVNYTLDGIDNEIVGAVDNSEIYELFFDGNCRKFSK